MVFFIKLVDFLVKSIKQKVLASLAVNVIVLVWKFGDWFMLVRANLEVVHSMLELS